MKDKKYFEYIVENINSSILITDKDSKIIYVNTYFLNTSGYSKSEIIGKTPNVLKSGKMSVEFYNSLIAKLENGEIWHGEFVNKNKNGDFYTDQTTIIPIILNKIIEGYVAIKNDISSNIRDREKMEMLAFYDALTNVPNRHYLKKDLKNKISRALRNKSALDFMFIDLDGFKQVNDTLGHNIGDMLLIEVANRLKAVIANCSADKACVFRTGGDEFAMALANRDLSSSIQTVKDVLEKIKEPIFIKSHRVKIGASIGLASFNRDIVTDDISLLINADIAMYEAKKQGKMCYVYFDSKLKQEADRRAGIKNALLNIVDNDELHILYQPIYSLEKKQLISFESFIRWSSKDFGYVSPVEIVSMAEELNIMFDLGLYIFKKACKEFRLLKSLYSSVEHVAINLSYSQLISRDSFELFKQIVVKNGLNPSDIAFEVNEINLNKNIDKSLKILEQMKEFGFKVVLDNFGTGNSSISFLSKFPFSGIKIDRTFTKDISNNRSQKVVKAIHSLAKIFNLYIVAEGIEDKHQIEILENMNIDYGQGYYFCEPKRIEEFIF